MPTITAIEQKTETSPVAPREIMYSQPKNTVPTLPAVTEPELTPALEAAKQEPLSPRFVQLARKEKALRAQQQQIQKEKEELKAKLAEYETSYIPKTKLSELAKNNPLGALEQMGITPDEFTQALLNADPKDAAIQKILQRIEAVETGQKQTMTNLELQQKQAYEQAVTQIRNDIKQTASSDPRFETIKEADSKGWEATEGAVALIETIFKEGWPEKKINKGTVISNDQALLYVQEWVLEKAYEMAQLKGVKEKFTPPPPTPTAEKTLAEAAASRAPAKTLSNNMNATKTTRLSEKERRQRAIAALTGELN